MVRAFRTLKDILSDALQGFKVGAGMSFALPTVFRYKASDYVPPKHGGAYQLGGFAGAAVVAVPALLHKLGISEIPLAVQLTTQTISMGYETARYAWNNLTFRRNGAAA